MHAKNHIILKPGGSGRPIGQGFCYLHFLLLSINMNIFLYPKIFLKFVNNFGVPHKSFLLYNKNRTLYNYFLSHIHFFYRHQAIIWTNIMQLSIHPLLIHHSIYQQQIFLKQTITTGKIQMYGGSINKKDDTPSTFLQIPPKS